MATSLVYSFLQLKEKHNNGHYFSVLIFTTEGKCTIMVTAFIYSFLTTKGKCTIMVTAFITYFNK